MLLGLGACAGQPAAAPQAQAVQAEHIRPYQPRPGRERPLVAVVGQNGGTELIDYVAPYGILRRSGVAEVVALGTGPGPMKMRPAITLQPQASIAQFDEQHPQGADYVVVPAVEMHAIGDPTLAGWLQAQAAKGATIVSICDGALVAARAGLFKGHRATGHWYTQSMREQDYPDTRWLKNTRYVADGAVVSSAGVTAAVPLSIALVEAIAGRERAGQLAQQVGVPRWDNAHDSERFAMNLRHYLTYAGNAWFSSTEDFELPVADGIDEVTLAATADSLARTMRSRVHAVATGGQPVHTANGLVLLPEAPATGDAATRRVRLPVTETQPAKALDQALATIDQRYGKATGDFVSLQLEYPR